jgi:hypothetical protein
VEMTGVGLYVVGLHLFQSLFDTFQDDNFLIKDHGGERFSTQTEGKDPAGVFHLDALPSGEDFPLTIISFITCCS